MVAYGYRGVFPAPRDRLWSLLTAHLDDAIIPRIHPLVKSQKTVERTDGHVIVEREIDARGKILRSRWKLDYRPPESSRWEVIDGVGPWAPGSYIENHYTDAPGGTMIQTRGDLKITVLPFFIPQGAALRRVFDTVETEDQTYLRGLP